MGFEIARAAAIHVDDWAALRFKLWPEDGVDEHKSECRHMLSDPLKFVAFVAVDSSPRAWEAESALKVFGVAEASLRYDYVNGCDTSPVAFLEGIYVEESHRRRGIAGKLIAAVQQWGIDKGCSEMASDAELENRESHAMHRALGFAEVERVVVFHKNLL